MAELILESQIAGFLAEAKVLPANYRLGEQFRDVGGHLEAQLELPGAAGSEFQIRARLSKRNQLDFSVILMVHAGGRWFRLRRYNGKSHEHTNRLERQKFYDFHIHHATERYQIAGGREDAFATPTDRYADIFKAFECLTMDTCGGVIGGTPLLF